jgi:malate dehydrogenase (oxaloacetate-decarboxylating)(NADP+)
VIDGGIATPVILGDTGLINELAEDVGLSLEGIRVVDPVTDEKSRKSYAARLLELRSSKGMKAAQAKREVFDHDMFAALMVERGDADAVLGGLSVVYPNTIRPALQVIKLQPGRTVASTVTVVVARGRPMFFADCAVNIEPTSEQMAEIAAAAAEVARVDFDRDPRVAFVSYSDFGSALGEEPARVRRAVEVFREKNPDIPADGEMQADTAVVSALMVRRRAHGPLTRHANILVFPNLTAANASYKLLNRMADAEVIGPILTGLSRSVHILQRDSSVGDIVNLTAIAVLDAQKKPLKK